MSPADMAEAMREWRLNLDRKPECVFEETENARFVAERLRASGSKRSRPGCVGTQIESIREYLSTKSVWINTSDEAPGNQFVMR
ncbi:MAG: hypothetical protein AAGD13_07905 [Pseudomonadota bacterium]